MRGVVPGSVTPPAFTLLELVVTIAVCVVLMGLLLPAMSRARATTDGTKCVANLRQIGCAIVNYSSDHDGYFPGPLLLGQRAWYSHNDGSMAAILEKYLLTAPIYAWPKASNVFTCPSYQRVMTTGTAPMYAVESVYASDGTTILRPWGYPAGPLYLPIRTMAELAGATDPVTGARISLSKTIAVHDTDQSEYQGSPSPPGWLSTLPKTPVHGDHQNALYFDWHVGRIQPLTKLPM